jgi:hypothetical protein
MLKNFCMKKRKNVQVRYEMVNIVNHPNFMLPDRVFNALGGG